MSRQEQIEKISDILMNGSCGEGLGEETALKSAMLIAMHLVDAGIGDKDRFEINYTVIDGTSVKDTEVIEPINYKEDK